jgi:hypothetical protein
MASEPDLCWFHYVAGLLVVCLRRDDAEVPGELFHMQMNVALLKIVAALSELFSGFLYHQFLRRRRYVA